MTICLFHRLTLLPLITSNTPKEGIHVFDITKSMISIMIAIILFNSVEIFQNERERLLYRFSHYIKYANHYLIYQTRFKGVYHIHEVIFFIEWIYQIDLVN